VLSPMIPSVTSTVKQKSRREEWCTGMSVVKSIPAIQCTLMRRFPSWLRSAEVLPHSM